MNKSLLLYLAFATLFLTCNSGVDLDTLTADSTKALIDTVTKNVSGDTIEKFPSEAGLLKMIRENYLDVMKTDRSFFIITLVSGCNCGFVDFETIDSNLTAFRAGTDTPGYWLLKGEDETYSSKIAKYYPDDIELAQPKRNFQEYGLFQSSTLIFELKNNSEVVRWISFDR